MKVYVQIFQFAVFLSILNFGRPARAHEYPLSSEVLREAHFFGRSTDRMKVARFLALYVRRFGRHGAGPYVGEIELRTPYEQVVLRSAESPPGYSAQQAQVDYDSQPDLIRVRVFLFVGERDPRKADLYTDDFGRVRDRYEGFWREFRFRVMQDHLIEPMDIEARPIYSRRGQGLGGAEVWLEINASAIKSSSAQVEVMSPDGQTVVAKFALDHLK